ncbi:DUF4350 domain-containing protein [Microbacterium sp. HD4P20]|uniref:DUF4350 domain-containing protein n=1 Tax=Microbacterium sp. HD4P20 TaxID=2864874 RepID=UPI001C6434F9|nr:DUF4350 domain-containing protein [Microbacterium sp. HD4P20]MCP2637489.1 DUF4350 domain-containing protein [Microbacterium sp. HD4P20]
MSAAAPVEVETASPRRGRRVAAWIAIGVALVVIGGVGAAITAANEWAARGALDPASAGPTGTRAIAEILRDRGVEVEIVRDRDAAARALSDGTATLILPDTPALSDDAVEMLAADATDIVLIDPRARTLDLFLPGASPAGVAPVGTVAPACDLPDAERSGPVEPGSIFDVEDADGVTACYPVDGGHGLLVGAYGGDGRVTAVDGRALFSNEYLADNGNAALAASLMGRHPLVVWYVPGLGDTDLENTDPSLGELTPPWVSPVIVLLLIAGLAAGIWRGRRFGPLVAERLPVMVRVSETTEGRARLYARSRDAVHAADQLRLGALERLARLLGLGPGASAPEIADAAAGRTGLDRGAVRGILIEDIPRSDADLVELSARLRHLEDAVHAAVRPERNPR